EVHDLVHERGDVLAIEGCRAAQHLVRITPREKMSERGSARLPITCSGDMYFGEPSSIPVWVRSPVPRMRAMPKSVIFTGPFATTMMLAGLMSRWTTPRWCA